MKKRKFVDKNYSAIFIDGKTLRIALDSKKPIQELKYPEFYDVKITGYCTGRCPYCYQDSKECDTHYTKILEKTKSFFGSMSENERPFQVALGGGNPNQHPDFVKLLKLYTSLGIMPNYTTNGIGLTEDILKASKKYCGGVAISCHEHLKDYWMKSVFECATREIKTNLHIIISDKKSIDAFKEYYTIYKDIVEYFVLLPYEVAGRAKMKKIDYEYLSIALSEVDISKVAFGANFYEYLKTKNKEFNISLYEPEILSKYLDMKDMKLYNSSFNLTEV